MLAEILRHQRSHLLVEVKSCPTTLKKVPEIFYKTKCRPTKWASNSTTRIIATSEDWNRG